MGDGSLILPSYVEAHHQRRQLIEAAMKDKSRRRCPAADFGVFSDTGDHYCKCLIESSPGAPAFFSLEGNPLVALTYCMGDYDHAERGCPTYLAKDDDQAKIERVQRARRRAAEREVDEAQVRSGLRVDDRGLEQRTAQEEAEKMAGEMTEEQARLREAVVAAHWRNKDEEKTRDPEKPEREPWKPPGAGARAARYRHWACLDDDCRCEGEEKLTRDDVTEPPSCREGRRMSPMRGVFSREQASAHFPVSLLVEADGVDV